MTQFVLSCLSIWYNLSYSEASCHIFSASIVLIPDLITRMVNTVVIGTSLLEKRIVVIAYCRDRSRKVLIRCQCVCSFL